jgi:hypothetical protein
VRGLSKLRTPFRILRTDTSRISSLSSGLVAIEGETHEGRETVPSPLSGAECAAYQLQVQS